VPAIVLPHLQRDGLRLRPPTDHDVPAILAACQDPDVQRFTRVPSPYTEADARTFVAFSARTLEDGSGVHLVAAHADTDHLLGAIGLAVDDRDLSGELGYWVAPEARGRGVATTGGQLLLELAFGPLDLGYVFLLAAATNPASNAVARRLGFTHEGTFPEGMLDGAAGDRRAPRCTAHHWGIRPRELPTG